MPRVPRRSALPLWLRIAAAGVGLLAIAYGWLGWREAQRTPPADAPRLAFVVDGLDCPVWCAVRLTEGIDGLDGARVESLDQKVGKVVVRHDPRRQNEPSLRHLFEARGFAVKSVERVEPVTAPAPRSN